MIDLGWENWHVSMQDTPPPQINEFQHKNNSLSDFGKKKKMNVILKPDFFFKMWIRAILLEHTIDMSD